MVLKRHKGNTKMEYSRSLNYSVTIFSSRKHSNIREVQFTKLYSRSKTQQELKLKCKEWKTPLQDKQAYE
jgi:hypothetical protein